MVWNINAQAKYGITPNNKNPRLDREKIKTQWKRKTNWLEKTAYLNQDQ